MIVYISFHAYISSRSCIATFLTVVVSLSAVEAKTNFHVEQPYPRNVLSTVLKFTYK